MTTEIWLALVAALFSSIGLLGGLGYKDISRRLAVLEQQDTKLFNAVLTTLIAKADDTTAIANAIHGLLTNGVKHD